MQENTIKIARSIAHFMGNVLIFFLITTISCKDNINFHEHICRITKLKAKCAGFAVLKSI